jgi:predicted nucleotidyltransferase
MMKAQVNKQKLKDVAKRFDLDLIVLFGSQATGLARADSDMDIAVRTRTPREARTIEWELALMAALDEAIEGDLDFVLLNDAPPLLLFEIATEGTPLHEAKPDTFLEFQLYAAKRHYDSQKFYALEWRYATEDVLGAKVR